MASQLDIVRVFQLMNENFQAHTLDARIIAQKKIYFIQEFGINLGYRFRWYIYGPYCFPLGSRVFEIAALCQYVDLSRVSKDFAIRNATTLSNLRQFFEDARRLPLKENAEKTERFWLQLASCIHFLVHKAFPKATNMQEVKDTILLHPIYNSNDVQVSTEFLKRHGLVSNGFE